MQSTLETVSLWLTPPALLLVLYFLWRIWRNPDFKEHRSAVAFVLLLSMVGFAIGYRLLGTGFGIAGAGAVLLLGGRVVEHATRDVLGGWVFEIIFSEGSFGEAYRRRKTLPNLTLLRHWREHDMVRKAYRESRKALIYEPRAFGHWLFAAETAALYLDEVATAARIIQKLCRSKAFPEYHKEYAVESFISWATRLGRESEALQARQWCPTGDQNAELSSKMPLALREACRLRANGRPASAVRCLRKALRENPEDLAAAFQLVLILTEDLAEFAEAERILDVMAEQPYVPAAFVDYARTTISQNRERDRKVHLAGVPPVGATPDEAGIPQAAERSKPFDTEPSVSPIVVPPSSDPTLKELLKNNRIGSALERLEAGLELFPDDFEGWMLLLDLQFNVCQQRQAANQTLRQLLSNQRFTPEQKKQAQERFEQWRKLPANQGRYTW